MLPIEIINAMMEKDHFSQWLGITVVECREGYCRLSMKIRKEMLNGFGIAHGGITYSLADSALAFASNSKGTKSLSIETSISHTKSLNEGDEIEAIAECETETSKMGFYKVRVIKIRENTEPVALFKGIVYKTSASWQNTIK
jgi:acyl-CoA thioesterase